MIKPEISAFVCGCSDHSQYNSRNEFVSEALVEAICLFGRLLPIASGHCEYTSLCPKAALAVLAKTTAKIMANIDKSERQTCEEHFVLLLESEFTGI